jgi:hypothetical protein
VAHASKLREVGLPAQCTSTRVLSSAGKAAEVRIPGPVDSGPALRQGNGPGPEQAG